MNYDAIVLAAGSGTRSQLSYNKVLYPIDGRPLLWRSIECFEADPDCQRILVACRKEELERFSAQFSSPKTVCIAGGKTRQDSVLSALRQADSPYVLIHDGARPFINRSLIGRIKRALKDHPSILPACAVVDTIKRVDESGFVIETPPRASLKAAQTPQAFEKDLILEALEKARTHNLQVTDDTQAVELCMGVPALCVEGDPDNFKVTSPQDLEHLALKEHEHEYEKEKR